MSKTETSQQQHQLLFDSDGLPWTSHLDVSWIIVVFTITGGLAAIPIGLCLGAWIRAKTQSSIVLSIYVLLAGACAAAFLPDSIMTPQRADVVGLAVVVLWFTGALIGRHRIRRYYTQREGSEFRLSLPLTLLFGVWYLNHEIRPEFPGGLKSEPFL
jgi:hypothetical protein